MKKKEHTLLVTTPIKLEKGHLYFVKSDDNDNLCIYCTKLNRGRKISPYAIKAKENKERLERHKVELTRLKAKAAQELEEAELENIQYLKHRAELLKLRRRK